MSVHPSRLPALNAPDGMGGEMREHACSECGEWLNECCCEPTMQTDMSIIRGACALIAEHRGAS